jgi:hypothetical protein
VLARQRAHRNQGPAPVHGATRMAAIKIAIAPATE